LARSARTARQRRPRPPRARRRDRGGASRRAIHGRGTEQAVRRQARRRENTIRVAAKSVAESKRANGHGYDQ
jgi:hypothetical protein